MAFSTCGVDALGRQASCISDPICCEPTTESWVKALNLLCNSGPWGHFHVAPVPLQSSWLWEGGLTRTASLDLRTASLCATIQRLFSAVSALLWPRAASALAQLSMLDRLLQPTFHLPALCPQLFNIYPWLGTFLGLHRPVMRKIEKVRAILKTILEQRRCTTPRGGPVQSYVDALIQQSQIQVIWGSFSGAGAGSFCRPAWSSTFPSGASLSLGLLSMKWDTSQMLGLFVPAQSVFSCPRPGVRLDTWLGERAPDLPAEPHYLLHRGMTTKACSLRPMLWPACWTCSWLAQRPPLPRCSGQPY